MKLYSMYKVVNRVQRGIFICYKRDPYSSSSSRIEFEIVLHDKDFCWSTRGKLFDLIQNFLFQGRLKLTTRYSCI